ncbi:MAG: NAD(P)/FAD-dependent oxidoreductase [Gemmataceae bacterium]
MADRYDCLVIGGGFYGLYLAEHFAARGDSVLLCDREPSLMQRASYVNQARVHNGYHYPRSILTALRSRVNFPRFIQEFGEAVDESFEKIYAVARRGSKVSAPQFQKCMERIGAPIRRAEPSIRRLFNSELIDDVFWTRECGFNAAKLADVMHERVRRAGAEIRTGLTVTRLRTLPSELEADLGESRVLARRVFLCGYAQTNSVLVNSGLPAIPLKHELTELALVEPSPALAGLGITVMDGPFFSCMPFPARGLYTLSHVRYTPHFHWFDGGAEYQPAYEICAQAVKRSAFPAMMRDAARYLPAARSVTYRESLWEVKTVLPRSETDDSRPILFRAHYGMPGLFVVMGGKIDNVYDVVEAVDTELQKGKAVGR